MDERRQERGEEAEKLDRLWIDMQCHTCWNKTGTMHKHALCISNKEEGRNNKQHTSREGQGDELWGLKGKIKRKDRAQGVERALLLILTKKQQLYINTMLTTLTNWLIHRWNMHLMLQFMDLMSLRVHMTILPEMLTTAGFNAVPVHCYC